MEKENDNNILPRKNILKTGIKITNFYIKINIMFKTVREIPASIKSSIQRIGTIPVTRYMDKTYFALAIDFQYGELTDFGGMKYTRRPETFIETAIRETREESCGVFFFTEKQIEESPAIADDSTCIVFVNVSDQNKKYQVPYGLQTLYNPEEKKKYCKNWRFETLSAYWIEETVFFALIKQGNTKRIKPKNGKGLHLSKSIMFEDFEKYNFFQDSSIEKMIGIGEIDTEKEPIQYFSKTKELTKKFFHPVLYEKVRKLLTPLTLDY